MNAQADIDALIALFYAAFDSRKGRSPSPDALRQLFVPVPVILKHMGAQCEQYTLDAFVAPRIRLLTGGELVDFHEWETRASTRIAGTIAARSSRYAKHGLLAGQPYAGQGSKFFQLGEFGAGWRIAALAWADDA